MSTDFYVYIGPSGYCPAMFARVIPEGYTSINLKESPLDAEGKQRTLENTPIPTYKEFLAAMLLADGPKAPDLVETDENKGKGEGKDSDAQKEIEEKMDTLQLDTDAQDAEDSDKDEDEEMPPPKIAELKEEADVEEEEEKKPVRLIDTLKGWALVEHLNSMKRAPDIFYFKNVGETMEGQLLVTASEACWKIEDDVMIRLCVDVEKELDNDKEDRVDAITMTVDKVGPGAGIETTLKLKTVQFGPEKATQVDCCFGNVPLIHARIPRGVWFDKTTTRNRFVVDRVTADAHWWSMNPSSAADDMMKLDPSMRKQIESLVGGETKEITDALSTEKDEIDAKLARAKEVKSASVAKKEDKGTDTDNGVSGKEEAEDNAPAEEEGLDDEDMALIEQRGKQIESQMDMMKDASRGYMDAMTKQIIHADKMPKTIAAESETLWRKFMSYTDFAKLEEGWRWRAVKINMA